MYRFYKIVLKADGTEQPSVDTYDDVTVAEGNFEFQKGLAMENKSSAFLMLLDNTGKIHNDYIAMIGDGEIKARLFEVKVKDAEIAKSYLFDENEKVTADFYKRLGGAKQDKTIRAIMLRGIGTRGEQLEYAYWVRPIETEPEPEATE